MGVCSDDFSVNCDECFEVSRADTDLTFVYGLTPLAQYYLWVIDKFRNTYKVLISAGADGSFTIDPTNAIYPNGLFNKYAGDFEIFLSTDAAGTIIAPVTVAAVAYNCVILLITSNTEIDCTTPDTNQCLPAYILDGVNAVEVASGEAYTCTDEATFNLIINQGGVEVYNEIWNVNDTNIINLN